MAKEGWEVFKEIGKVAQKEIESDYINKIWKPKNFFRIKEKWMVKCVNLGVFTHTDGANGRETTEFERWRLCSWLFLAQNPLICPKSTDFTQKLLKKLKILKTLKI